MPWSVYILRCRDASLYTGITNDLERRLAAHARGRGAAYTRGRGPLTLVYREAAADRGAALSREWVVKQLTRPEKERLIMSSAKSPAGEFDRFTPATLDFFRRLKRRNTKVWFEAHRAMYEVHVKEPMRALVEEMDVRLARFAPEIVGDPRRSVFRIHRDVRFSRDKSPYRTSAACWFYHRDAGKGIGSGASGAHGGAGFWFSIGPEESSIGAGVWMPPGPTLAKLREALAEDPRGFERALLTPAVRRRFGPLDEDAMLKRLPRGFGEGHPAARWLRYQSFTVGRRLSTAEVLGKNLPKTLEKDYRMTLPLVRWLNRAIGFLPVSRRV